MMVIASNECITDKSVFACSSLPIGDGDGCRAHNRICHAPHYRAELHHRHIRDHMSCIPCIDRLGSVGVSHPAQGDLRGVEGAVFGDEGRVHVHAHAELLPLHVDEFTGGEVVAQVGLPGGTVGGGVEEVLVAGVDSEAVGEGSVAHSCETRGVYRVTT